MGEDKIQKIYNSLNSKFELPDYNTFKKDLMSNPEKRQKAFQSLGEDFEMPSFGQFEAEIFGNVPDEPKNPEREPWYKVVGELFNISQPEKMSSRVGELFSSILTGAEQMFSTDAVANYAETLVAPLAKHLIKNDYDKRDIFDPTGLGHILEEPVEKKTEQEKEVAVKQVEKREHQLFTKLANDKFDIEQKYVDMGFIDREHTNVLRDQGYSLGLNLPFVAIGGGAMKLGFSGIATATQFLGYPLFTIAEANSFAGEVYSDTAKKDKDGRVIEGTGDIHKAEVGQIFGTIAGMFEFAGPHQALSIFKESTGTLAKELSNKEVAKKLLKIMSVEGIEEGVYQGPIEQLTKMGLNLQDKFSFEQSLDEFVGGSVGGLLLGGFSVSSNVNRLQELKDFAEKDVIPKIDRMEKAGIISKEKADNYRETANVLVNTPVDELQPVVEKINESLGDMRMEAGKVLKDMQTGYNVYDTILKSDLEDPYARYDTAIPDKTFRNEFVKAIESSPEFQTLQKELGKQNPNLQVADLVKLTHKQLQDSNGQEKTKVLTDARGRLLDLSLMAGKQLELYDTLSDGKSVSTTGNEDGFLFNRDIIPQQETPVSFELKGSNVIPFNNPKSFEVTSTFDKWLGNQNGRIDLSQPFRVKDLSPFGQRLVEQFRKEYLAKNNFTSVPKERIADFKKDWNTWLKSKFGLRHKEGRFGEQEDYLDNPTYLYGLNNIIKEQPVIERVEGGFNSDNIVDINRGYPNTSTVGSEVIISGDFLLKDMPHEYIIGNQEGAGLGWYIYSEINGEPFIYEWQSDILPDLFGNSVSSTRKFKDANGNDSEVEILTDNAYIRVNDQYHQINKIPMDPIEADMLRDYMFKEPIGDSFQTPNGDRYYTGYTTLDDGSNGEQAYWYVWEAGSGEGRVNTTKERYDKAKIEAKDYVKELVEKTKITKQEFEAKKEELSKQSAEEGLKDFIEQPGFEDYLRAKAQDIVTYSDATLPIGQYNQEVEKVYQELLKKELSDKVSVLPTLESLYKRYWNIWLMHSFIYAKEKGHNTVWLPTGESMYEIEGSKKTAAMYATKFDLDKKVIGYEKVDEDFQDDDRDFQEQPSTKEISFDKVGPYWTALNKIKGIKLELSQPEWSTVPLIKADISGVETGAVVLFNKEVPNLLYEQSSVPTSIYSQLGDKTVSGNVRIESWATLKDQTSPFTEAYGSIVHIISTRIKDPNKHFGNPFSHEFGGNLIKVDTIKEAVEKYIDWVINSTNERAKWIREQLKSGKLKGKPILYYKELGEPSHATALDYLINKYDWNASQTPIEAPQQAKSSNPSQDTKVKRISSLGEVREKFGKVGHVDQVTKAYSDWLLDKLDQKLPVISAKTGYFLGKNNEGKDVFLRNEKGARLQNKIILNVDVLGRDYDEAWKTLVHEGTHEFLFESLNKDNKTGLFNQRFYNEVDALMKEVKLRFETDQRGYYQQHKQDLDRIFAEDHEVAIHEFVAYMRAQNSKLADWARNTPVSNNSKSTYLERFFDIIKRFFARVGVQSPTFMDALETIMNDHFGSPAKIDYWDMVFDDTSGIYDSMEEGYDKFDKIQDPDNTIDNPRMIRAIGKQIANELGETATDYISYVKSMSFEQFKGRLFKLSSWKKSAEAYYTTQKFDFSSGEFMQKLAIQLYEYATSLEKHPTVRLVTRFDSGAEILDSTIEELGDTYRNKDNAIKSGWRNKIKLSERIPILEQLLGAKLELVYLDDEKYVKDGSTTWNAINEINFNLPKRNETYVRLLAKHNIIFPGTWSDKGTVVGLRIKEGEVNTADIMKIYDEKISKLKEQGLKFEGLLDSDSPEVNRAMAVRLLIEDLRLGGSIQNGQLQSSLFDPDDKNSYDLIKILKRPTEVAPMVSTIQTADRIADVMKGDPIGIEKGDYGLEARAVIFNAIPEKGKWIETFEFKGQSIQVDMHDVFVNELGTPTTDGILYYLQEGFGKAYRYLHGVINPGAFKFFIVNSINDKPLYIKSSGQLQSTKDFLGQWMKKNKIGLLISSESAKVNKVTELTELNDPSKLNVFNIKFSDIHRDKETGVVKKSVRGSIQSMGANLDTKNNPFFVGDYTAYQTELLNSLLDEFDDQMINMDGATILQELKEVALNSTSQFEQSLARIILDIAYTQADENVRQSESVFFMDAKEEKITRNITNQRIAKDLGGLFHEPYFAEILKSRISKALHKVANYKGSSTWAVLRPDLGFAEMSKIEALWDALMAKEQTKRREELPTLYKERENLLGTGNQELIESVDKDIQRIESSIASDTEEIRAEVWKKIVDYIDIKSGRLKENVSYISEDIAEKHHIAPLDDTILTVVPSDGMIAQQANVTIPVSLEYMDNGTVVGNSEHTQTKDGKDFDVDKGQIRGFNSQYTTKKAWDGLVKTIRNTQEQHKKLALKYYQEVLKDKSLTEKDIYSKEVQLKFMQILSDSEQSNPNSYYDPRGIFGLLDMFAKDIGGVINDRKDITTKDQIGFTSSFSFDGKIYNFNTAQSNLPLYYLIAMRMTNDAVDRPTNENGLHYTFSELKLAEYQYGLKLDDTPANGMAIAGMKKVDKFLFRYATRFTSGGNLDERGAERGLAQDLSYAYTQQEIWKLLNGSRADKRKLAKMYETWYVNHNPNQKASTAQTFIRMGQEYIINSTIQNPTGSPLMNSVNRLPLHRIPNLGTSEKVYRVWQYLISQSINKKHSDIAERVSEKWGSAIKEFRSPVNRQYVTNFLLTSENPRLHLIKAITIGFILPVDQRLFKEGSEAEGKFLTDIFNKANEIVYPKLIQQLFQGKTFIFNRTSEASFDVKEGKIILSKAPYNGLKVTYRKVNGEVTEWKSGYDLLNSTTTEARGVRNVLFSSKGIFSTYGNRYKLSQMISFGRNIPMQGRLDYVKDFLDTVMPQMTIEEKELFWHSLLGYPDPSDSYGVREAPTKNTEKTLKDVAAKIKTPMNLVPFSVTENPDQKTLLQIAELVEDKSGKDFLNEYARTATEVYPGLGIDKAIEIKSEIDNGGMSAPTILFTKADNRYNDEAYDATKAFNNIYDIFQKSEVYVEGEDLGVYPRISGRIGILTKEDVTESIAPLPTKQAWKPKYESVALRKARMLLQMMKTFNSRLDRSHTIIDHSIQNLRGTGQSKEDIISRINLLSEKFFGIDFFVDNATGKINYLASNGATYNDETIDKMLADYNVLPEDYGYYKSALELRKIYDHWNPQLAKATVNYLTYLKNHIPEGFMNTPIIDSYINKWTKLGEQFQGMKGKYFPRMYKEGVYDGFLEEWALWNVINEMNPEAEAQEIARLYREARASGNLSEEVQTRVNREITTLSVDNYDGYVHTWQRERVIPEWVAEGKYITDTMDMHSKHMIQFQNAVVNDITTAEALLYEHNASVNGQTKEIISQMLQWYGNMTTDKNLKAEKVTTDKIKSGNNVAFYYRQNNREKRIRGVVNRVEGDSIYLEVDPEIVTRNIQRNIQRYERTHDNIISNPNIRPEASATSKQMAVIQNLVDEGYLDAQREYTILDANDAIVVGLRAMLEDQANWGRFRKDRIYVKQYQGTRGVSVPNKVERSLMNTPKELRGSWKDADANWQRLQLVTANMFLGNPGAAVRNYNQAMYRIVQDFGWLRYFNIPGKYYQLLDKLPADVQKKLPFSEKVAKRTNEVYGGIRKRANKFTSEFLLKAKEGTLSEYHKILYPIINGSTTVKQMDTDGKLKVVEALAAQYLVENSLTTTKDIGNAYVKEVGAQGTQKLKDDAKSILLIPFLSVEGKVRRDAAFLYAYKAVFYDNVSDLRTIKTAIEKGVALANSLYDQMERKLIEDDAKGKFLAQFSQFNTFQWSMFKLQIEQAKQLGQLRDVNGVDDIIYNLKSIFAIERTIDNPDGTKTTFKIGDTVDPLIPARLAKYLWQDTIASVYNFAFPGLRVGNPVNQTFSLFFAMVINMIRTGELPDEWDFSDWLFGLVAFKFGLGITLPAQLFYNAITGKKNIMSMPKMVTASWDIISDQFSSDRKNRISDEWYIAGQGSKLLTGMDLTPHSRKYYSKEQNELTKTAFKKVYKPLVGEIDLGPLTIPVPSDNLLPIYNLSKYLK